MTSHERSEDQRPAWARRGDEEGPSFIPEDGQGQASAPGPDPLTPSTTETAGDRDPAGRRPLEGARPAPPLHEPGPARVRAPGMWPVALVALWVVLFVLAALLSGDAALLIPLGVAGALVVAYAAIHVANARRVERRHGGDARAAAGDHTDPIPSTADLTDDERPIGDTPEVHDDLAPEDLPKGHPSRIAVEREAALRGGTTDGIGRAAGGRRRR